MTRAEKLAHAANAILSLLPSGDRTVLERRLGLHDGHVHTHHDIAEDLGMSLSDVKAAEGRAMEVLREHVAPEDARQLLAA